MRLTWQVGFILLVAMLAASLGLQHQRTEELRGEIALVREQNREIDRLREEQRKLTAMQLAAKELEALRTDHAAVMRLRVEIDAMQTRVREMERAAKP